MSDRFDEPVHDLAKEIADSDRLAPRTGESYPSPAGGFLGLLHPWRGYAVMAAAVVLLVVIVLSLI